ncbi:MAG TPA: SH3 domain-containing protein [Pyrinomonadaceae bacterium]|nr:SH3 domain-containing protein [Pyrinomonadaceae bacterium]
MRRTLLLAAALVACLPAPFSYEAHAGQGAAGKSRITIASGVRLRGEPDTKAEEVGRLQLGVVVEEIERSAAKARVGEAEDYWYMVAAPGGARGWVFGALTEAFDPASRGEVYRRLASARVANAEAKFAELADLVKFTTRALKEVTTRADVAELELLRLQALARSLASVEMTELEKEPYRSWVKGHDAEIVYSEPAGQWYVNSDVLWRLREKYKDLPVAERIAWEAASTPLPGECEGYVPCYLYKETLTNGRYLELYPQGEHAAAALGNVTEWLGTLEDDVKSDGRADYEMPKGKEDRDEFNKSLAAFRAQLAPVRHPLAAQILRRLVELARGVR